MAIENEASDQVIVEIIDRVLNLQIGKQAVIVIFSEDGRDDVDLMARGIHPSAIPEMLEQARTQYLGQL